MSLHGSTSKCSVVLRMLGTAIDHKFMFSNPVYTDYVGFNRSTVKGMLLTNLTGYRRSIPSLQQ